MAIRFGKEFRLYYNTAYAMTVPVKVPTAQDITSPDERSAEEYELRDVDWVLEAPAKRKGGFSTTLAYDDTDAAVTALQAAYIAETPLVFWLADGDILDEGAHVGLKAWCKIKKFEKSTPMSGLATVAMELGFHYVANEPPAVHTHTTT
jgi:hypothetical protein